MTRWSDERLTRALAALPEPTPPDVGALLERAVPERTGRAVGAPGWSLAAGAVLAASLPLVLPVSARSRAWSDGLARRGVEWSSALIEHFDEERP